MENSLRLAMLWRGDPDAATPAPQTTRQWPIFEAVAGLGIAAEPVIYDEQIEADLAARLASFDGVMVWVNPIADGRDRAGLDALLRRLSATGLWVSAHPDVVGSMGVKAVLHRTRELGWGVDTALSETLADLARGLPARLAAGPRVVKPNRGNDGIGVFRVSLAGEDGQGRPLADLLAASEDMERRGVVLEDFIASLAPAFERGEPVIDQPLAPRLGEGMVRAYLAQERVAGFSEQAPRSGAPGAPEGAETFAMASAKTMRAAEWPAFQGLRRSLEEDWVPGLLRLLDLRRDDLPALWDADFLYGPRTGEGEDSFILCEINVSSVAPFPPTAAPFVAEAAHRSLRRARSLRRPA